MNLILSNIHKHIKLSKKEESFFLDLLVEHKICKKDFLQRAGDPCHHIHFVCEGILRAFFINKEGKEATIMFATADWWITDMDSFLNKNIADVSIQAVSDALVLSLSKTSFELLFDEVPAFNKFFRILMQNAYCREQRRSFQTLSMDAKERYNQFNERYPDVAKHVTQKQIASYLGITPEFLSYLRSQKD